MFDCIKRFLNKIWWNEEVQPNENTAKKYKHRSRYQKSDIKVTSVSVIDNMPDTQLALFPSLGTTALVNPAQHNESISFRALIIDQNDAAGEEWDLCLWYSLDGADQWQEAKFDYLEDNDIMTNNEDHASTKCFKLDLNIQKAKSMQFTAKYKKCTDQAWTWTGASGKQSDGHIILKDQRSSLTSDLDKLFSGIDPAISITTGKSQVRDVLVWNAVKTVPRGFTTTCLGLPLEMQKYMTLVKINSPWLGPDHGKNHYSSVRDGLSLQFLRFDAQHVVVLPIATSSDKCRSHVVSDNDGKVMIKTRNDSEDEGRMTVIITAGLDKQAVFDAAMYRAREIVEVPSAHSYDLVRPSWQETWVDGLAYCTWNGLGRELTEQKILDAMKDLSNNGIKITSLIIDDNWQDLNDRRWVSFEANKEGFPQGLKSTVTKIRQTFPHIKHIAVWHALLGYWEGIAPGGTIDQTYQCATVRRANGGSIRVVKAEDADRFYHDFYSFLNQAGIDAVKTDVQCDIDGLATPNVRASLFTAYQTALKKHSKQFFDNKIIYCMCHVSEIFYGSLIQRDRPPVAVRNSDDIPQSHSWHVFANCYNTIMTSHLNCYPDFDMFQTTLPNNFSSLHAAARCISGGPIYITDSPGKHNLQILNQMAALSPRGVSTIIRPSCICLPVDPYVGYHDNQFLKVGNFTGSQGTGTSLLAVFNTTKSALTDIIPWTDFRGSLSDAEYLVRAHSTGQIGGGKVRDDNALLSLSLDPAGWEIFSAVPLQSFTCSDGKVVKYCTFGAVDMMVGSAAVVRMSVEEVSDKRILLRLLVKVVSKMGIWTSHLDSFDIDDMLVCVEDNPIPKEAVMKGKLLEIDLRMAWNGFDSNRTNELEVQCYLPF